MTWCWSRPLHPGMWGGGQGGVQGPSDCSEEGPRSPPSTAAPRGAQNPIHNEGWGWGGGGMRAKFGVGSHRGSPSPPPPLLGYCPRHRLTRVCATPPRVGKNPDNTVGGAQASGGKPCVPLGEEGVWCLGRKGQKYGVNGDPGGVRKGLGVGIGVQVVGTHWV